MAQRGKLQGPLRYLFYSANGVGKSTLAAACPGAIAIDVEDSTSELDVFRYPFHDGAEGHIPQSFGDVTGAVEDLRTGDHNYTAVIIDTVDRLEAMLWDAVCDHYSGEQDDSFNKKGGDLENIEAFGYGKGYTVALAWWRRFCTRLDALRRERGMEIILLGHATIKTFKNPSGEDFDRYQLRMHEKAAGFLHEWAHIVGFAAFEDAIKVDKKTKRAKAFETGARILHFARTAAYDAKTRVPLPDEMLMDLADPWGPLAAAVKEGRATPPSHFLSLISAELERIGDPKLVKKVSKAIKDANGDTGKLSEYLNSLRDRTAAAAKKDA